MKKLAIIVLGLLAVGALAFAGFGYWMFGGEREKEAAAIHVAESLGQARLSKLARDCEALVGGRPLKPPLKNLQVWSDATGYPEEFRDLRPLKIGIGEDSVSLVIYQCFDEDVTIEVSGLKTSAAKIVLRCGDYQSYTYATLWKNEPTSERSATT